MTDGIALGGERASRPVLLTVDDDPGVSQAITRDLRSQYGQDYRILRAASGAAALDVLRQLKLRGDDLALLLADYRMPEMNGITFLEESLDLFPDSKRILLTAYADTDAAIRAINQVHLDHYLLKPWDPPEDKLYPVVDDLLDDWRADYHPTFDGVRVVGHRWSARSHEVKDFLARNMVPYRWLDVADDPEAQQLLAAGEISAAPESMPVVMTAEGTILAAPSDRELAAAIGLSTRAELPFYDLIIVGGGPAGLAAAVYGASEGLRTVLIEARAAGGQAGQSSRIENYLGFPTGLSGSELARRAIAQAKRLGAELIAATEVCELDTRASSPVVRLTDGSELSSHAVIIATGVAYRRLTCTGIDELTGSGVYYGAAATEARRTEGADVYMVGGANSVGQAAVYCAGFARSVTLLVRGDSLEAGMSQYLIDQIRGIPTIHVRLQSEVTAVQGDDHLETISIMDRTTGRQEDVPANFLFVFIGAQPHTEWVSRGIVRDKRGFILSGLDLMPGDAHPPGWPLDRDPLPLETSVPGVFVAGDVRHSTVKRVASAVGEGAMAVSLVHQYLAKP
ncbi:MAG TPA: FAD-dependent oxidoreductase [Chloroflexota bacterium]|nr:FAD-dependent oxidoreductase [Chloroflexota bacterium]